MPTRNACVLSKKGFKKERKNNNKKGKITYKKVKTSL